MESRDSFKGSLKVNILGDNPIFVQMLGICSTLAVTGRVSNTLVMTIAVVLVTAFSSFTISLFKYWIPKKIRMIVQVFFISFYVILIDLVLSAYFPDMSNALGAYVGLIITNCIIMGRAEAFAQSHRPFISFWDGFTSGLGYMIVLVVVAIIRELMGFGSIAGLTLLSSAWFTPWLIMVTPASAFFVLAFLLWGFNSKILKKEEVK